MAWLRHVLPALVIAVETALLVAGHPGELPGWAVPGYALVVASVIALRRWSPLAAFVVALLLAPLTGTSYVLLLWASYQAGRETLSRAGAVVMVGAVAGTLAVLATPATPAALPTLVSTHLVFVALPVLAGRYVAQQERLVATLDRHNRQLRRERELLAEQGRLRERLRIARDMHDSLGHRLSLVSVQAAALEVAALPDPQRQAVRRLAGAARDALNELYELVGALRGEPDGAQRAPGVEAIDGLVRDAQAAGVPVTLHRRGTPAPLAPAAGHAAYRVVQEGLTNAAKHAPGQPVTVRLDWEADALLVSVVNPVAAARRPTDADAAAGHGLAGLHERVGPAGGFVEHRYADGRWRLVAMLPLADAPADVPDEPAATLGPARAVGLGLATAAVMFVAVPAIMVLGVGG